LCRAIGCCRAAHARSRAAATFGLSTNPSQESPDKHINPELNLTCQTHAVCSCLDTHAFKIPRAHGASGLPLLNAHSVLHACLPAPSLLHIAHVAIHLRLDKTSPLRRPSHKPHESHPPPPTPRALIMSPTLVWQAHSRCYAYQASPLQFPTPQPPFHRATLPPLPISMTPLHFAAPRTLSADMSPKLRFSFMYTVPLRVLMAYMIWP
jgi:hypothetical protein